MDHPVGAFIHNRGRGERIREHPDNYHSSTNRSLQSIIDSLNEARLIFENHNAKPMTIESEALDAKMEQIVESER